MIDIFSQFVLVHLLLHNKPFQKCRLKMTTLLFLIYFLLIVISGVKSRTCQQKISFDNWSPLSELELSKWLSPISCPTPPPLYTLSCVLPGAYMNKLLFLFFGSVGVSWAAVVRQWPGLEHVRWFQSVLLRVMAERPEGRASLSLHIISSFSLSMGPLLMIHPYHVQILCMVSQDSHFCNVGRCQPFRFTSRSSTALLLPHLVDSSESQGQPHSLQKGPHKGLRHGSCRDHLWRQVAN